MVIPSETSATSVLIPLPAYGFDPTEAAVPFLACRHAGHQVFFATPEGAPAVADEKILRGEGLGIWKHLLMADENGRAAYKTMVDSGEFQRPMAYADIRCASYSALLLPGGHDKAMRPYLESRLLQKVVAEFFSAQKPVGAICHGVLLAARSRDLGHGKSVLWGRKTTGLTFPQEMLAHKMTSLYLGDYYLTYPDMPLETEVKLHLKDPRHFERGHGLLPPARRDNPAELLGFALRDGNYLSARWPGDAHTFAARFLELLK